MTSESPSDTGENTRTPRTFGERVRLCRDLAGIGQQVLATKVGVSLTTIQNYEGGQYPKGELAVALANALGCSLDWLLAGKEPIFPAESAEPAPVCDVDFMFVPMVEARVSAGTGSFQTEIGNERLYAFRSDFLSRKGQPSQMVLMRVSGDSMEPEIRHGDTVLIDQAQCDPRPGMMYAVRVGELIYLKVVDSLPEGLVLKSINPAYEPLKVDMRGDLADGVKILGKVIWWCREAR